jgi:site-specific DNA recombinase
MSTERPLRAALLARVSTDMQAEEGLSIPAQLAEMREFCEKRGWKIVAEFIDAGYTGSTMERPGLQGLLAALEQRAFDVAVVHELSRLSRSIFDTFDLFETFGRYDVGFASVKEPNFDFTASTGKLFLTLMAALNQYYLDLLRMHTAKGKRERARQGLYNALIIPFGYKAAGDARTPPVVDPQAAEGIRLAFETYGAGKASDQEVADLLNDRGYRTARGRRFSKDTIRDLLQNRFYVGDVAYGTKHKGQPIEYFRGQHEPLISEDLFQTCQEIRRRRAGAPRTYQQAYRVYLLNGIAYCDVCGRSLRGQSTRSGLYYREMFKVRGFRDCPNAQVGTRTEVVDAQVGRLFGSLSLPEDWQQQLEMLLHREEELMALERRRERLEAEKRRLKQLYIRGEFEDDMSAYDREKRRIDRELSEVWDGAEQEERRDLLRLALKEVQIDVAQGRVTALQPYPPFIPLFRELPTLVETEPGLFTPLWPPDTTGEETWGSVLEPVKEAPAAEDSILWPFVFDLPQDERPRRITPVLSRFLLARRTLGVEAGVAVENDHPGVELLQIDPRSWPDGRSETLALDPEQPRLPYADDAVSFLRTSFLFQWAPDKAAWLDEIERVLDSVGWWVVEDLMPASMPVHWLYQFFPEARKVDLGRTLDPQALFVTLLGRGFQVKTRRRTYDQAVSLGAIRQIVAERERIPPLALISDEAYQAGVARIEEELAARGADALWPSHLCVVELETTRGTFPGRKR